MKKRTALKTFLLGTLLWTWSGVSAGNIPDISTFKDLTHRDGPPPILLFEDFEQGLPGWTLGRLCKPLKQEGMTATAALKCERTLPKEYGAALARIPLNTVPGNVYKVTAWYRTENIMPENANIRGLSIEHCKDGKYQSMINTSMRPTAEWKKVELSFTASQENNLLLRLFYDVTGKVYWDNLKIELADSEKGSIYLTSPRQLQLDKTGAFSLKAHVWTVPYGTLKDHAALVEIDGKKFFVEPDADGNAAGTFGDLPEGTHTGKLFLLDMKEKTIVAKNDFTVLRGKTEQAAAGGATLDKYGRVLVDGKPFLPVGIYCTWIRTEENLKRIADGGFNFVLTYTPVALNIQKEKNSLSELSYGGKPPHHGTEEWKRETRASLDIIARHGLKLMNFPADDLFRHDVLLAAYTADERPVTMLPELKQTRLKYAEKFPGYPVVALTDKMSDYIAYAQAADILGIDPYPIRDDKTKSMTLVRDCLLEASRTGIPIMMAPQAFHHGAHSNHPYTTYRYPTEEEIRSMTLLAAIYGCKWFCFYSYTTIWERQEKKDPGSAPGFWLAVTASAKMLRALAPWILSLEKAPEVKVENKAQSIVDVKAMVHDGKCRVLVAASGPGKAEAILSIPGKTGLKSRYNRTRELGDGRYLFSGNNITSDILEEK